MDYFELEYREYKRPVLPTVSVLTSIFLCSSDELFLRFIWKNRSSDKLYSRCI
jgi:hypothetical protein